MLAVVLTVSDGVFQVVLWVQQQVAQTSKTGNLQLVP